MPPIRQLSASVVNKIAAGEVIERPASVVKELLENAIDAGAARVEVSLVDGGRELIRVADDGCGIPADELPLAVASHATSKIAAADDLFRVSTLGFRGEALASISEVSQLVIRSRWREAESGAELEIIGGQMRPVAPCGCPVGTTVEVQNLFYNTPVRGKFLRTTQTEAGHASEAVTRVALAWPAVHITLRHNQRVVLDLPPAVDWGQRIAALFGDELARDLLSIDSADGDVRLSGFVAHPTHSRANNRMQYLLLNGRPIRDRSLQHALGEAYRGLLLSGRFPIAFLRLDMPADMVDVNVHPTKLEVRFQDSGRIYSQLLGTLRTRFLATDLTTRIDAPAPGDAASAGGHDREQADRLRGELVSWAKGEMSAQSKSDASTLAGRSESDDDSQGTLELDFHGTRSGPLSLTRLDSDWSPARDYHAATSAAPAQQGQSANASHGPGNEETQRTQNPAGPSSDLATHADAPSPHAHGPVAAATGGGVLGMQVQNRYLVTENEQGVVIIDQHALHERILYEQLREKVLTGQLETQKLLVPETVPLTAAEAAAVLEARDELQKLGIEVEPFGGDTVLVSTYPAMLANLQPQEVLRQAVEQLINGSRGPQRRDLVDDLLHMIACKAAIKAGDRLAPEEVTALLDQRHAVLDAHHCPHGRPTELVFTRQELDRRFKRT